MRYPTRANMNEEYIEIELEEEPIELCKLLKVLNLVEGGGQAKNLIAEGYVGVNHEICTIKRKKLYSGDILEFDGELFQLALTEDATPVERPAEQPQSEPSQAAHRSQRVSLQKINVSVLKNLK